MADGVSAVIVALAVWAAMIALARAKSAWASRVWATRMDGSTPASMAATCLAKRVSASLASLRASISGGGSLSAGRSARRRVSTVSSIWSGSKSRASQASSTGRMRRSATASERGCASSPSLQPYPGPVLSHTSGTRGKWSIARRASGAASEHSRSQQRRCPWQHSRADFYVEITADEGFATRRARAPARVVDSRGRLRRQRRVRRQVRYQWRPTDGPRARRNGRG
jgi:hypothetical protein